MSDETTKEQADKKEAEVKAEEKKPEEAKPVETKPAETAPAAEAKPVEAKPAETKAEAKPADGTIYYYPNKWARIVFTSAEEVMGDRGVTALLNMANMKEYIDNYPPDNMKKEFPFERVGQLQQAIWDMYGNRGARVFATRAGEQSFKDGLSQFKSVAAAAQIAMKVGTLEAKAKIGLEFFSKFFNAVSDQVVEISEDDKHWIWTITRCPVCWNRKSDEPVCHLAVGVLQAAFAWISDNKKFRILETDCKAKGDKNCVFKIEKVPVE
jgi:predicted hydrocarbon binding protein